MVVTITAVDGIVGKLSCMFYVRHDYVTHEQDVYEVDGFDEDELVTSV